MLQFLNKHIIKLNFSWNLLTGLPQGQEKSGKTKKKRQKSVKNGYVWKKSGYLTKFEKNFRFFQFKFKPSNGKKLIKNRIAKFF